MFSQNVSVRALIDKCMFNPVLFLILFMADGDKNLWAGEWSQNSNMFNPVIIIIAIPFLREVEVIKVEVTG